MTDQPSVEEAGMRLWNVITVTPMNSDAISVIGPQISAFEAAVRADTLRRVREAVEGERLTDDTGHPQDIAYNQAIADALAALDRIAEAK